MIEELSARLDPGVMQVRARALQHGLRADEADRDLRYRPTAEVKVRHNNHCRLSMAGKQA